MTLARRASRRRARGCSQTSTSLTQPSSWSRLTQASMRMRYEMQNGAIRPTEQQALPRPP